MDNLISQNCPWTIFNFYTNLREKVWESGGFGGIIFVKMGFLRFFSEKI